MKTYTIALLGFLVVACDGDGGGGNPPPAAPPPAANQAPTITAVADQTIEANTTTGPLTVTLADDMTAAAALVLSTTSDNAQLLGPGAIQVTVNGADRAVVVTPQPSMIGVANVTLTVTDANGATATGAFMLTVNRQRVSTAQLVRDIFADPANNPPRDINALELIEDATNDDFADLL